VFLDRPGLRVTPIADPRHLVQTTKAHQRLDQGRLIVNDTLVRVGARRLLRQSHFAAVAVALAMTLALAPFASGATVVGSWSAKVGPSGANGTAKILITDSGTGTLVLKLTRLQRSALLPVVISRGTCGAVGVTVVKFASIKTSSTGLASRSNPITVAQAKAIALATTANGRLAIRIGAGAATRCGAFTTLISPPYVAKTIPVGRLPSGVTIDPTGVWVTNWLDNTVSRIDPASNTVLAVVPITLSGDAGLEAIASGAGSLWMTTTEFDASGNSLPGSLVRLDPLTGNVLATIAIGKGAFDVAVGLGAVWLPSFGDNTVLRVDPTTNQVVATIPVAGGPSGVTTDASSVWVVSGDGTVSRIDPASNQIVASVHTQTTGGYIAVGSGGVWVSSPGTNGQADGTLSRIDPATNQVVASIALGRAPDELAIADGSVWVAMFDEPTVVRVSAATNAVLNRIPVGANVYSIDANAHSVWAVHNLPAPDATSPVPAGTVTRINY
jgi:YVTN family beta-propeller protein